MDVTLVVETALGITAINPLTDSALKIADKVKAARAAKAPKSAAVPAAASLTPAGAADSGPAPAAPTPPNGQTPRPRTVTQTVYTDARGRFAKAPA